MKENVVKENNVKENNVKENVIKENTVNENEMVKDMGKVMKDFGCLAQRFIYAYKCTYPIFMVVISRGNVLCSQT